jgi:hypothetical protein
MMVVCFFWSVVPSANCFLFYALAQMIVISFLVCIIPSDNCLVFLFDILTDGRPLLICYPWWWLSPTDGFDWPPCFYIYSIKIVSCLVETSLVTCILGNLTLKLVWNWFLASWIVIKDWVYMNNTFVYFSMDLGVAHLVTIMVLTIFFDLLYSFSFIYII